MLAVDQTLDHRHDLGDRLARARLVVGPPEPETVGVGEVRVGHLARELVAGDGRLARGRVDLVVDVGDVGHQRDRVALVLEEPLEQREDHERARVADVDRGRTRSGRRRRSRPGRARAARAAAPGRCGCRAGGSRAFAGNPSGSPACPRRPPDAPPVRPGRVCAVAGKLGPVSRLAVIDEAFSLAARSLPGRRRRLRRHLSGQPVRHRTNLGGPVHSPRRAGAQGRHAPPPRRDDQHDLRHVAGAARGSALGRRSIRPAGCSASAETSTTRSRSRACSGSPTAGRRCCRSATCPWVATGSRR